MAEETIKVPVSMKKVEKLLVSALEEVVVSAFGVKTDIERCIFVRSNLDYDLILEFVIKSNKEEEEASNFNADDYDWIDDRYQKYQKLQVLNTELVDLNLSVKAYNSICSYLRISNPKVEVSDQKLGNLLKLSRKELSSLRMIGKKRLNEVSEIFKTYGVSMRKK
jgi:DNA-directed RNA polymerase alpha subunit